MADMLHRITIGASPESVFDAITTVEGLRTWWAEDSAAEPRVGSEAVFRFVGGQVVFRMRIDSLDRPNKVRWTCVGDREEWIGTELDWDLEPDGEGGTRLRFRHRGWRSTEGEYPTCNTTWGHLMYVLRDYAEGKPVETPFPA